MEKQRQEILQMRFETKHPPSAGGVHRPNMFAPQCFSKQGLSAAHKKHYSCRSATMGSTRMARRAGM
jgi:hypothetical protein